MHLHIVTSSDQKKYNVEHGMKEHAGRRGKEEKEKEVATTSTNVSWVFVIISTVHCH